MNWLAALVKEAKKRLAIDRNNRFRLARQEVHRLATFHRRSLGQRVRQQKNRINNNLF